MQIRKGHNTTTDIGTTYKTYTKQANTQNTAKHKHNHTQAIQNTNKTHTNQSTAQQQNEYAHNIQNTN